MPSIAHTCGVICVHLDAEGMCMSACAIVVAHIGHLATCLLAVYVYLEARTVNSDATPSAEVGSMPGSAFDALSEALEEKTSLFRIEARDRLRLALKEAGVEPARPTVRQLEAVLRKNLPHELLVRGIDDSLVVCDALVDRASGLVGETGSSDTPEDVFRRLGG
jgi:hypothetical protein